MNSNYLMNLLPAELLRVLAGEFQVSEQESQSVVVGERYAVPIQSVEYGGDE